MRAEYLRRATGKNIVSTMAHMSNGQRCNQFLHTDFPQWLFNPHGDQGLWNILENDFSWNTPPYHQDKFSLLTVKTFPNTLDVKLNFVNVNNNTRTIEYGTKDHQDMLWLQRPVNTPYPEIYEKICKQSTVIGLMKNMNNDILEMSNNTLYPIPENLSIDDVMRK